MYAHTNKKMVAPICIVSYVALRLSGHADPISVHPMQLSAQMCLNQGGPGCYSKLSGMLKVMNCESLLDPFARSEGWVGRDIYDNPVWNVSRGIAQIGNGWGFRATDSQAYSWVWSVFWLADDLNQLLDERVVPVFYPECGISVVLPELQSAD